MSWFTYIFRFRFSELRQILFLRQSINIWTLYAFVSYYILFIWYTKARHQLKFLCQNDKDLLTSAPILSIYSTAGVFSFCQLFIYIAKEVCMISCYSGAHASNCIELQQVRFYVAFLKFISRVGTAEKSVETKKWGQKEPEPESVAHPFRHWISFYLTIVCI